MMYLHVINYSIFIPIGCKKLRFAAIAKRRFWPLKQAHIWAIAEETSSNAQHAEKCMTKTSCRIMKKSFTSISNVSIAPINSKARIWLLICQTVLWSQSIVNTVSWMCLAKSTMFIWKHANHAHPSVSCAKNRSLTRNLLYIEWFVKESKLQKVLKMPFYQNLKRKTTDLKIAWVTLTTWMTFMIEDLRKKPRRFSQSKNKKIRNKVKSNKSP